MKRKSDSKVVSYTLWLVSFLLCETKQERVDIT